MNSIDPPSSDENAVRIVLQRLEETGNLLDSSLLDADPSFFLGAASKHSEEIKSTKNVNLDQQLSKFWVEAHAFSCMKHSSFESSVKQTYIDTVSPLIDEEENNDDGVLESKDRRALHLDMVKQLIDKGDSCAYIRSDGTIVNPSDSENCYRIAFCLRGDSTLKGGTGAPRMSHKQLDTVARLSAININQPFQLSRVPNVSATKEQASGENANSTQSKGWFQSSTSFAYKFTRGINSAIDSVLTFYDGDDGGLASMSYSQRPDEAEVDVDDAHSKTICLDADVDDAVLTRKGKAAEVMSNSEGTINIESSDGVISMTAIADVCRCVLEFSKEECMAQVDGDDQGANNDFFAIRRENGDVERVVLHRHGFDRGSFGSFCRQAAKELTMNQKKASNINFASAIGRVLSNISDAGVDLLSETLGKSCHALIEETTLTIFPGGIPSNFESSKTDHALFHIHTTKNSIQNRMTRLEQDAERAKKDAISAQRKGTSKVALVHMRRRKAAMEELERCASILTNLDASELRLERAKTDVQLVQSFSVLKEALQDIRTTNNIKSEDMEDLMEDIREEMEANNSLWEEAGNYPGVSIDENELEEEFKLLQLECDNEKSIEISKNDAKVENSTQELARGSIVIPSNDNAEEDTNSPLKVAVML